MNKVIFRVAAVSTLILIAAACSSSRPEWADGAPVHEVVRGPLPVQSLDNLPSRLLAAHNKERAAVGAPPLVWDANLAAASAAYGPLLAARGELAHSPPQMRVGQGENLWMGTRGAFSLEEMVGDWAGEKRIFRPGIFPNVSTSGNWSDVGHYTQIVWRGTARVGCAVHQSPQWDYLVCRYSPPGNVMDQPVP